MVVARCDLSDTGADYVDPAEASQEREELAAAEAPGFRGAGPWCKRRVEDVDVETWAGVSPTRCFT